MKRDLAAHGSGLGCGLRRAVCAFALGSALGLHGAPVAAQSAAETVQKAAEADAGFVIEGFRSARFGMDEAEIRKAIEADFGLGGTDVELSRNPVERTQILTVLAPEVLPEGGKARVAYILGYQSKALIQVGVSWRPEFDDGVTIDTLRDNADILKTYFLGQRFVPETVKSDVIVDDGLVLFRGVDDAGHAVLLMFQGSYGATDGDTRILTPTSLELLYMADPEEPDIFQVERGSF